MSNNYMNLSINVAKAIFTTSDKGACVIHDAFSGGSKDQQDNALKEYIYAKYFIAMTLLHAYEDKNPEASIKILEAIDEIDKLLADFFDKDLFYGCTIRETHQRCRKYLWYANHSEELTLGCIFLKNIGDVNLLLNPYFVDKIDVAMNEAQQFLMRTMVTGKVKTSSGCLSVVACMTLMAFVLFSLVLL